MVYQHGDHHDIPEEVRVHKYGKRFLTSLARFSKFSINVSITEQELGSQPTTEFTKNGSVNKLITSRRTLKHLSQNFKNLKI